MDPHSGSESSSGDKKIELTTWKDQIISLLLQTFPEKSANRNMHASVFRL